MLGKIDISLDFHPAQEPFADVTGPADKKGSEEIKDQGPPKKLRSKQKEPNETPKVI